MRKGRLTLALLAMLAVVLLVFLRGGRSGAAAGDGGSEWPAAESVQTDSGRGPQAELGRSAADAGAESAAEAPAPPEGGVLFGLRLFVCDPDGAPVPGAEVWWYPGELDVGLAERREAHGQEFTREARARELCAEPLTTGADGRVVLPVQYGRSVMVLARAGELSGSAGIQPWGKFSEERLALSRLATLRVRVVDTAGAPVSGARVGLESQAVDRTQPIVHYWCSTGDDGLATLQEMDPQWVVSTPPLGWSRWIALLEPFEPRVRVHWDPADPPEQPVVLTLPPHGSVTVAAVDDFDAPAPDGTQVSLHDAAWGWPPLLGGMMRGVEDGTAAFPFVGIGLELDASADVAQRHRFATVRAPGPNSAGEHVTIRVGPDRSGRRLTGRIVADGGLPEDRTWRISLTFIRPGRGNYGAIGGTVRLDSGRRFDYAIDPAWLRPEFAGTAIFALASEDTAEARLEIACVEFPWPPQAEIHDLGEIPCGGELLVAGRVEDYWGRPMPRFRLGAGGSATDEDGKPYVSVLADFSVRTDDSGTFAIHGAWPAGVDRLRCWLGREDFPGPAFVRGQDDLLVRLPPFHGVRGRLLLDPATILPNRLSVYARIRPEFEGDEREFRASVQRDGSFHLMGLPQGAFRLDLQSWEPPFEMDAVASFTLDAKEEITPPELDPLDLRGRFRNCTIRVRSAVGDELDPVVFHFGVLEGSALWRAYGNPATFLIPVGYSAPAQAKAEAHRVVPLDWSLSEQELVLPPLPRVSFRVTGLPSFAEEFNAVELRLQSLDPNTGARSYPFRLDDRFESTAWVPEAGDYEVRLTLLRIAIGTGGKAAEILLGDGTPLRLEVPDEGLDKPVILSVTTDALAAALLELRTR